MVCVEEVLRTESKNAVLITRLAVRSMGSVIGRQWIARGFWQSLGVGPPFQPRRLILSIITDNVAPGIETRQGNAPCGAAKGEVLKSTAIQAT